VRGWIHGCLFNVLREQRDRLDPTGALALRRLTARPAESECLERKSTDHYKKTNKGGWIMALPLLSVGNRPIDIIINDHSIRYIEIKPSNPPQPIRWGERFLPPGLVKEGKIVDEDTLSVILDECIDTWKIRRRKVRFLAPDPFVTIRKVSIPTDVHDDEIKGYLYLEIGASIHLPFEDPVFDFLVLPREEDKKEILLFAANRQYVMQFSELFSSLKLIPESVDLSSLALYRLYNVLRREKEDEKILLLQFDLDLVVMSIFENEIPFFMRHHYIPYNENDWDIKIARSGFQQLAYIGDQEELKEQFDEAIKEINKLIDFYQFSLHQGKNEISKIVLTGDNPFLEEIGQALHMRLDIEVEILDVNRLETLKTKPMPRSHYLAFGLALKGV
jgi:type IV pilus assembly protein PilM